MLAGRKRCPSSGQLAPGEGGDMHASCSPRCQAQQQQQPCKAPTPRGCVVVDLEAAKPPLHPRLRGGRQAAAGCETRGGQPPWPGRKPGGLWRLLALLVAAVCLLHMAGCGLFFCVRLSTPLDGMFTYLPEGIVRFRGPTVLPADASSAEGLPSLIPRIVHQLYRAGQPPSRLEPLMESWAVLNEGWELRRYSEDSAATFVAREFPEYAEAYRCLPTWADKADFFKFLVVLRLGGVYADINTECMRPLDELILPKDTLLVGWQAVLPSAAAGFSSSVIAEAVFGGAPGHPALREVADQFSAAALRANAGGGNSTRDAVAGRAASWTEIVLRHAVKHPLSEGDPWSVRILAGVVLGLRKADLRHVYPFEGQVAVLDHSPEDGRGRGSGRDVGFSLSFLAEQVKRLIWPSARRPAAVSDARRAAATLRPVSAAWDPPFTVLAYCDEGAPSSAAAELLTTYGLWQPALAPHRSPNAVEAVVGPLALKYLSGRALLDVGAGNGFFSLAAASRGHPVVAFELADGLHRGLAASVRYNGFSNNVTVVKAALGSESEVVCVRGAGRGADEDAERGYGRPEVHALGGEACERFARREPASALLPDDVEVGAVRVSVNGWEARVLAGLAPVLVEQRPWVVLVELFPHALAAVEGRPSAAVELLQSLYDLGFNDVSHSGYVCDERWANITAGLRAAGALAGGGDAGPLRQPTWCRITPDLFPLLADAAKAGEPENVLFAYAPERRRADADDVDDADWEPSEAAARWAATRAAAAAAPPPSAALPLRPAMLQEAAPPQQLAQQA